MLMIFSGPAVRQSSSFISTPKRFDRYNNLCWDDEKARLDNFAIQLGKSDQLVGEIIVYAGRISCPDEAEYRSQRAKKWVLKRGIKSDRVVVRDGGYREEVETEIWLGPAGLSPVPLGPTLTKDKVSIRKRCIDKVFANVLCLNR